MHMSTAQNGPYAVVVDLARHTWGHSQGKNTWGTLGAQSRHKNDLKHSLSKLNILR